MNREGKNLVIVVPAELVKTLRVNHQMVDVTPADGEWREVVPGSVTSLELTVDRELVPALAPLFTFGYKPR